MGKIQILSAQEIKKIAAGEVVERPANVVKELVENSLDANAIQITIYVEDGGKKLIRVIDNGCGMSADDVEQAFDQHATSKIVSVNDLQTLQTFGFRGEALSSIASVSNVTIVTKEKAADVGVKIELAYGVVTKKEEIAASDGTDITIRDIFSNVPARKKFLKATETEWRQIILLFQSSVLAHKHVHFKLFHDGRLIHNCPPAENHKMRILQLWNQQMTDQMLEISLEDDSINLSVSGLISNHQYGRYNTSQIFFFVNGRWIKNYSLMKAVLKGYSEVYQQGRYPAVFLFIKTDAALIDVNIHPRKEEVKFIHARKIEQLMQKKVHDQLNNFVRTTLQQTATYQSPHVNSFSPVPQTISGFRKPAFYPSVSTIEKSFTEKSTWQPVQEQRTVATENYQLIGQFHQTYILLENDDGLLLVDQHAAHERVLYELFKKRFEQIETIKLMFPQTVTVDNEEMELLVKHQQLLAKLGIVGDQMGADRFVIKSVPIYLKNADLISLIKEIVGYLNEAVGLESDQFVIFITKQIHAQMACKAAVKAGDELSREKMTEIINQLEQTENRLTCPHGRPTIWFLSLSEIEKKFRRDYKR